MCFSGDNCGLPERRGKGRRECGSVDIGDEELHASLANGTGRARALVERMLVDVCEADEIDV